MSDQETQVDNQETQAPAEPVAETSKRQMSFAILEDGTIRAEFGEGIDPLTLNPAEVPESLQSVAMAEGLVSRARAYTGKLTGDARTPQALKDAVAKGFANLLAGIWKVERAPGEGDTSYTIEVEAAFLFRQMRAKAKNEEFTGTLAEAAVAFSALSDDDKKTLKALPRYQLAYAQVKEQRAAATKAALEAKLAKEGDDSGF